MSTASRIIHPGKTACDGWPQCRYEGPDLKEHMRECPLSDAGAIYRLIQWHREQADAFALKDWNDRPPPERNVVGTLDTDEGSLLILDCDHTLYWHETDDIPRLGAPVGCEQCV